MKQLLLLITMFIILNSHASWGGEKEYHCKTKSVFKLNDDGDLKSSDYNHYLTTFIVDKISGLIEDGIMSNEG